MASLEAARSMIAAAQNAEDAAPDREPTPLTAAQAVAYAGDMNGLAGGVFWARPTGAAVVVTFFGDGPGTASVETLTTVEDCEELIEGITE